MGTITSHEACPRCRKEGRHRHGDNLARYSDGGSYCFSCGYFTTGKGGVCVPRIAEDAPSAIGVPGDCITELPPRALLWLEQYALTEEDIKLNHILWSPSFERIIFPIFIFPDLVGWVGRYMGDDTKKSKAIAFGKLHEDLYVLGNTKSRTIVLTEDIVSAIKVSHQPKLGVAPLFGSHISTRKMLIMIRYYDEIIVWLDKDKQHESIKFSRKICEFGGNGRSVITDKDPKEYSDEEIKNILTQQE